MKINYLFPHRWKKVGWITLILGILGLIYSHFESSPACFNLKVFSIFNSPFLGKDGFFQIIQDNMFEEFVLIFIIIGSLLVSFSKEKEEDEYINKLRLESLVWAIFVNYIILLCAILFIFGVQFLFVMLYNMFTILIFFIIKFHWELYKLRKTTNDEK